MAVGFAVLDKRIGRDTNALHDFLWQGVKEDEKGLVTNLVKDATHADVFLKAGGRLRKSATALAKGLSTPGNGESLFELLGHSWGLAAATVLRSKGEHRSAAGRAKDIVSSASIGVCANAGCFEFVQEWEGGKIDFDTYANRLSGFLEAKGVIDATQFRRMLTVVFDLGANWNGVANKSEQQMASRAAIDGAAWCLLTSVSIRELLGAPPRFAPGDFAEIVTRIVDRA